MISAVDLYNRMANNAAVSTGAAAQSGTVQTAGPEKLQDFSGVLESAVTQEKTEDTKTVDMDTIFEKASAAYGVPLNLIKAVAKTESNFNPDAVSSCGAQGVMQLMPSTAAGLGVTDSFDAEQNIMGGTKYLSQMLDRYDGDVKLTLAAYNAGSGNVAKYGGVPPFKETQAYVQRVMEYMGQDYDAPEIAGSNSSTVVGVDDMGKDNRELTFYTVTSADKVYTQNDYERFVSTYQETLAWNKLKAVYEEFNPMIQDTQE